MRHWLVKLRKDRGLTQEEAARGIGISRNYLSDLERGEKNPSWEVAGRLADFYEVEILLSHKRDPLPA